MNRYRTVIHWPSVSKRRQAAWLAGSLAAAALLAALLAAGLGAAPGAASTGAAAAQLRNVLACRPSPAEKVEIAAAKLIIEYNYTDDDMGVHGAFDDHGWSELCVYDPSGRQILAVKPRAQLKDLTMAGIFFESREPPGSEFSYADLKAAFPEGEYQVRAHSFDGTVLAGAATFTHDVPAAPVILAPEAEAVVPLEGLIVEWEPVTETIEGGPVTISGYQVIITDINHEDPHGFSTPIFDVHLPPDRTSLSVPAEFLEPGTEYELEILALEVSGNQTIAIHFFQTE